MRMAYRGKIKDMAFVPSSQTVREDLPDDYGLPF